MTKSVLSRVDERPVRNWVGGLKKKRRGTVMMMIAVFYRWRQPAMSVILYTTPITASSVITAATASPHSSWLYHHHINKRGYCSMCGLMTSAGERSFLFVSSGFSGWTIAYDGVSTSDSNNRAVGCNVGERLFGCCDQLIGSQRRTVGKLIAISWSSGTGAVCMRGVAWWLGS